MVVTVVYTVDTILTYLLVFYTGYAWAEDKEHCEEYGRMLQADPNKVSARAKKRGLPQVGCSPLKVLSTSFAVPVTDLAEGGSAQGFPSSTHVEAYLS